MVDRVESVATLAGLPRPVQIGVYSLAGVGIGLAVLLVRIANATSYLSDDPQACINCHVMTDAYASWQRGSHGRVAVCIDCHVPHDSLVAKYAYKARDGLKHSYVFTLRQEPQVLNLSSPAIPVIQSNCLRCHERQVSGIGGQGSGGSLLGPDRQCWSCHQNIHGKVRSLSASPALLRPELPAAGLEWRKKGDGK
jgi:cytochrome c nitrite reductase small subunit